MRLRVIVSIMTLVPALGMVVAVGATPPSAYALPSFEMATAAGPLHLTPLALGVRRTDAGFEIDEPRFDRAVDELANVFRTDAVPDHYELADGRVLLKPGRPGVELDTEATKSMLLRALRGSNSNLTLPIRRTAPAPPPDHAIVVALDDFRIDLYRRTDLSEHFPVGIGQLRFPTPPGAYYIRSKARNPSWRNPGSRWARGMPAYLPPGPRNPLGTRALRLDRGALVIHGTPQPWTIGRRSSHGCIRMRRADVEKLFDIVAVGTPVFILT